MSERGARALGGQRRRWLAGLPASTLSFHLKELTYSGLVTQERDGRHLIYRPALDQMNALLAYLTAHCCQGTDAGNCEVASAACTTC